MGLLVPLYLAMIYRRFMDRAGPGMGGRIMAKTTLAARIIISGIIWLYLPFAVAEFPGDGVLSGYAFLNIVLGFFMALTGWDLGVRMELRSELRVSQGIAASLLVLNYALIPLVVIFTVIYSAMTKSWNSVFTSMSPPHCSSRACCRSGSSSCYVLP